MEHTFEFSGIHFFRQGQVFCVQIKILGVQLLFLDWQSLCCALWYLTAAETTDIRGVAFANGTLIKPQLSIRWISISRLYHQGLGSAGPLYRKHDLFGVWLETTSCAIPTDIWPVVLPILITRCNTLDFGKSHLFTDYHYIHTTSSRKFNTSLSLSPLTNSYIINIFDTFSTICTDHSINCCNGVNGEPTRILPMLVQ